MDTSENSHFRPNLSEDLQQCKSQNFTVLLILQRIFMVNFKEMLEKIEKLRRQNSAGPDWGTKLRAEELDWKL